MESEINDNFTIKDGIQQERLPLALETAFSTLWSITVPLNALLVFIIMRFKRLRTTTNLFVANWHIADLISILLSPAIVTLLSNSYTLEIQTFCFLMETEGFCHSSVLIFQILIIIDWLYINNILVKYVIKWKNSCMIYIIASWTTIIFSYLISTLLCPFEIMSYHGPWVATVIFVLLATVTIISHIINCCNTKRNSVTKHTGLILVTVAFMFRVANEIYLKASNDKFAFVTALFIKFCSPITIFIFLYFLEKDFNTCLKQFCKCNAKEVDDEDKQRNMTYGQCQNYGEDFNILEEQ